MSWKDILKGVLQGIGNQQNQGGYRQPYRPPPEPQQRQRTYPKRGYGKIALWLKTRYGNRFSPSSTPAEIENQLTKILEDIQKGRAYRENPKLINGFRAYIAEKKFEDLVRVE